MEATKTTNMEATKTTGPTLADTVYKFPRWELAIENLAARWNSETSQKEIFETLLREGIFDDAKVENLSEANNLVRSCWCKLADDRKPGRGTYASNRTALRYRRGPDGRWEFTPAEELKQLEAQWDQYQRGNRRRKEGRSIEEIRTEVEEVLAQHKAIQEGLDALPEDNPAREFLKKQLYALQDQLDALQEEMEKARRGSNAELIRRARAAIIFCSNTGATEEPLITWLEMVEALYPPRED